MKRSIAAMIVVTWAGLALFTGLLLAVLS